MFVDYDIEVDFSECSAIQNIVVWVNLTPAIKRIWSHLTQYKVANTNTVKLAQKKHKLYRSASCRESGLLWPKNDIRHVDKLGAQHRARAICFYYLLLYPRRVIAMRAAPLPHRHRFQFLHWLTSRALLININKQLIPSRSTNTMRPPHPPAHCTTTRHSTESAILPTPLSRGLHIFTTPFDGDADRTIPHSVRVFCAKRYACFAVVVVVDFTLSCTLRVRFPALSHHPYTANICRTWRWKISYLFLKATCPPAAWCPIAVHWFGNPFSLRSIRLRSACPSSHHYVYSIICVSCMCVWVRVWMCGSVCVQTQPTSEY